MLQRLDAALGFFPSRFVGFLEQNLEEQPPVAVFQHRSYFGSLHRLAGRAGDHQRREDFLRFQPMIKTCILQLLGKLLPEAFRFRKHSYQPPLDGLGGARDEFRLGLYLAATFRSRLAQSGAQHRLLQTELLGDARGPLGAQDAVWNLLDVREEKIHRAQLPFSRRQIHLPRPRN